MNIESVNRPALRVASITVRLSDVASVTTDEEIRFAAYRAAGETRESTFGTHVERYPDEGRAVVSIYRD